VPIVIALSIQKRAEVRLTITKKKKVTLNNTKPINMFGAARNWGFLLITFNNGKVFRDLFNLKVFLKRLKGQINGGESGIRTHDTIARIHTFQACAMDLVFIINAYLTCRYKK
jgi:hypothetical protein